MTGLVAQNPQIRNLRRLAGRRRSRHDDGLYLIEGPVLVGEALEVGAQMQAVYFEPEPEYGSLLGRLQSAGVPTHEVANGVLTGITDSVHPRPILALVEIRAAKLGETVVNAQTSQRPLVVLVDVRDPGNVGTILRAATASGAAGVVCTTGTADPWAPKVVRSAAGALERVPVVVDVHPDEVMAELSKAQIQAMATVAHGGLAYFQAQLSGAVAIFLGNEAHGLDEDVLNKVDGAVTIPMEANTESLNVAMTASILCFEALRQRLTSSNTTIGSPA